MNTIKKPIILVIVVVLIFGLFSPAIGAARLNYDNLHPQLIELAAESPDQVVTVMVQKADGSDQPERLVEKLGGQVTKTLKLINAFVAKLPAGRVTVNLAPAGIRKVGASFDLAIAVGVFAMAVKARAVESADAPPAGAPAEPPAAPPEVLPEAPPPAAPPDEPVAAPPV